jgi:hypothetical protein
MIKAASWIGTWASLLGSFIVACHWFLSGYVCFLVGCICWLFVAVKNQDNALLVLNMGFLLANVIGLYNAIV